MFLQTSSSLSTYVICPIFQLPVVRMDKSTTNVTSLGHDTRESKIRAGSFQRSCLFIRRNLVGIVCDNKEMYLQIEIQEEDRPYFRLLWRDLECERQPDVYEFGRVGYFPKKKHCPYGVAVCCTREEARRNEDRYPLAAETVKRKWMILLTMLKTQNRG